MSTAALQRPSDLGPVVVMGVCGSGKSTVAAAVAETPGVPFIEGDRLHPVANVEKVRRGIALTDGDRWPWLAGIAEELKRRTEERAGSLVSCSALRRVYRDRLRRAVGPMLRFAFLKGSKSVLNARLQGRKDHFMPRSPLEGQVATLEVPIAEAGVLTVDVEGPPAKTFVAAIRALAAR